MTDVVEIGTGNVSDAFQLAQTIRFAGATTGFVVESGSVELSTLNTALSTADGEFSNTGTTDLDITINHGEAYVGGTWLCRDTTTDVTVTDDTTTRVFVGWDISTADTVIIGPASDFATNDPKIPLFDVTAASGSITGTTDLRTVGDTLERDTLAAASAGSEFNTFGLTGAASTPIGTLGDSNNEVARVYGTAADVVLTAADGDGWFNVAANAYLDSGTWKYIAAGKASRVRFDDDGSIDLSVAASGSADGAITWKTMTLNTDGDLVLDGTTLWDESAGEVVQSILGGAASSLSTYPIPASDIDDGPGSGLDADTVDGIEASAITGQWEELDTFTDSNTGTDLEYDSQAEGVTFSHDRIRVEIYRECTVDSSVNYQQLRVNGISTTSYDMDFFDAENNVFTSLDNQTAFGRIAGTNHVNEGDIAMQVIELACPAETRSVGRHYPVLSTPVPGVIKNVDYIVSGMSKTDISAIDRVHLFGGSDATGKVRVLGRDVF